MCSNFGCIPIQSAFKKSLKLLEIKGFNVCRAVLRRAER